MLKDKLMESIITAVIYIALFFGCILCILEKFEAGQFLLMVAWVGFIGLCITKKIERLMMLKSGASTERMAEKSRPS